MHLIWSPLGCNVFHLLSGAASSNPDESEALVVMVFLCEDVSSRPLTELIANQVEKLWRQYAVVGHTDGYIQ